MTKALHKGVPEVAEMGVENSLLELVSVKDGIIGRLHCEEDSHGSCNPRKASPFTLSSAEPREASGE